jgi:tetratricopeptide (TPR) repeat protein
LARLEGATDHVSLSLKGWVLIQLGEYQRAVHELRSLLRTSEPTSDVLTNLGYAYAAVGAHRKAVQITKQARALNPSSRLIAFNLVGLYVISGGFTSALEELDRIRKFHPHDLNVSFAKASIHANQGDIQVALREMQAAKAESSWRADSVERAELAANITFLEWKAKRRSRTSAIESLERELERIEFRSLKIARMLAAALDHLSDAERLRRIYTELLKSNPRQTLAAIEMRLHMLEKSWDKALDVALEKLKSDPLDPGPVITATFVLSEVRRDHAEALRLGEEAMRRLPGVGPLANNVAYAAAQAGDADKARFYLLRANISPLTTATQGLIALTRGDLHEGLALYDQAAKEAAKGGDKELAALILLRKEVAAAQNGLPTVEPVGSFSEDVKDSVEYVLLCELRNEIAER